MYPLIQHLFSLSLLCLSLPVDRAFAAATVPREVCQRADVSVTNHLHAPRTPQLTPDESSRPRFGNLPYGPTITHCNIPGTIALTFDDGPSPYTEQVLDLLDQHGAKATFFVNGDNFGRGSIDDPSKPWPGLIRRMHNSGHQIGSHTWSHADLTNVDSQTRLTEVSRLETALVHILGFYPTYFRPPFAHCDAACEWDLGAMGYHVVNFDVDTKDYLHTTSEDIQISQNIFAGAVSGNPAETSYLVLSHDVWEQTARKLVPFMLNTLEQRGFKAVTVGECLGDPVENWYRS